jgi:predicted O-methyltransferase YrrM
MRGKPMNSLFANILSEQSVIASSGERFRYHSGVSTGLCEVLTQEVSEMHQPRVLEIGMAYGTSSVHLADGIQKAGGGALVSIDPNQHTQWHGVGVELIEQTGHGDFFQLIESPSWRALPELASKAALFDFIFIDGWHSFDFVFVDFFFCDQLLRPGGLLAFHDCGMPATAKVLRFIETHKAYTLRRRIPYGFNKRGRVKWWLLRQQNRVRRVARFLLRADTVLEPAPFKEECRIYRKISNSLVPWDHHCSF